MNALEHFQAVAGLPLSRWLEHFPDRRPLGLYNAYVPEELFYAAGLTPVYVFHRPEDRGHALSHLPNFTCWPARSLIDQAAAGELHGLAGMAFPQTCDTVKALAEMWRRAEPSVPAYYVGVPAHLAAPVARPYLIAELERLRQTLGGVSDAALQQAFSIYNHTRGLMARLYERAADLGPTDLYATLRAAFVMPKEEYNALLKGLLGDLTPSFFHGPRLIVVGPHLADPAIYHMIEEAGGRVVDDLLDIGRRYFEPPVTVQGDLVSALADRILATLPTPSKHHPARRRDNHLIAQVTARQADGVIFARQKFCDPHGFDYANARLALSRAGIPSLLVELEQTPQLGQMRTRVQAFCETIGHGNRPATAATEESL